MTKPNTSALLLFVSLLFSGHAYAESANESALALSPPSTAAEAIKNAFNRADSYHLFGAAVNPTSVSLCEIAVDARRPIVLIYYTTSYGVFQRKSFSSKSAIENYSEQTLSSSNVKVTSFEIQLDESKKSRFQNVWVQTTHRMLENGGAILEKAKVAFYHVDEFRNEAFPVECEIKTSVLTDGGTRSILNPD